jgi:hypothetical protein
MRGHVLTLDRYFVTALLLWQTSFDSPPLRDRETTFDGAEQGYAGLTTFDLSTDEEGKYYKFPPGDTV